MVRQSDCASGLDVYDWSKKAGGKAIKTAILQSQNEGYGFMGKYFKMIRKKKIKLFTKWGL